MTDDEIRQLAGQARIELDLTERAFDQMRGDALNALLSSAESDRDEREDLYRRIKAIDYVRAALRRAVQAGELADHAETIRAQLET